MLAVTFKTLGLLPGSVTQAGRFEVAGNIIRVRIQLTGACTMAEGRPAALHLNRALLPYHSEDLACVLLGLLSQAHALLRVGTCGHQMPPQSYAGGQI